MLGAALVWLWLVLGLRMLSGGGAWQLGWGGAFFVGTLLWPVVFAGYYSLKQLAFGSQRERDDELASSAWDALMGLPVLVVSFVFSVLVLGLIRFMDSFSKSPHGGVLNLLMSVLALHLLAWGAAGASHWAWTAWKEQDE
ncbi:MAG: hypothetical protein AD742_12765 [Methylibium sp. NZG]|nr:MAG: hypothetical protein AD742_12765 [Methylibium sp. NZG]